MGNATSLGSGAPLKAGKIIEGAMSHSHWLEEEMSAGEEKNILTAKNPGLQAMIVQHSDHGPSDDDCFFVETRDQPNQAPSPLLEVTLPEIDQRGEVSPFIRFKPEQELIAANLIAASARATARVGSTGQLNLLLLMPYQEPGAPPLAEREYVLSLLPDLKDLAASKDVVLRYTDLMCPGGHSPVVKSRMLPLLFAAVERADLVLCVASDAGLPTFADVRKSPEKFPWLVSTFDAAVAGGYHIERHEQHTLLELVMRYYLDRTRGKTCPAIVYRPTFDRADPNGLQPRKEARASVILTAAEKVTEGLFVDMSKDVAVERYESLADFRLRVAGHLEAMIGSLLPGREVPAFDDGTEHGGHLVRIHDFVRTYIDLERRFLGALEQALAASHTAVVTGPEGIGKTALLANYVHARRRQKSDAGAPMVVYHNFAHSTHSRRLTTFLKHMLTQLKISPEDPTPESVAKGDVKEMLRDLPIAVETVCQSIAPRELHMVLPGVDLIEEREFCTGDHENHALVGPKLFNADKCLFATEALIPDDPLNKNNIIVKPRRNADLDSVSPIILEKLLDGGKAVNMIKAGQQLAKSDVRHEDELVRISDEATLSMGLGLRVSTEPGKLSGKNEMKIIDVGEGSIAEQAGLANGNIITHVGGESLSGVKHDEAVKMMVAHNTLHILVETEKTGRQHTQGLGWLPSATPGNFRLVASTKPGVIRDELLKRKGAVEVVQPHVTYQHADKLVTVFAAEKTMKSHRNGEKVPKTQSTLSCDQVKRLSQGFATGTRDREGRDMYLVTGSGASEANGWYRQVTGKRDPAAGGIAAASGKNREFTFVRRAPAVQQDDLSGTARRLTIMKGLSAPEKKGFPAAGRPGGHDGGMQPGQPAGGGPAMIDITLGREQGKGWVIRKGQGKMTELMYVNGADSNHPPASYWAVADSVGSAGADPPPKIYNVTKLAQSRTPEQLSRVVAANRVGGTGSSQDSHQASRDIYIVEGAGDHDVDGWYLRESNADSKQGLMYVNRSSPSGTVYVISPQKGGWCISKVVGYDLVKLFRYVGVSGHTQHFEFSLPPTLGWSAIREQAKPPTFPKKQIKRPTLDDPSDDEEEVEEEEAPLPPAAIAGNQRKSSSWAAKMGMMKMTEKIRSKLGVFNRMAALKNDPTLHPPRVRCLVAPSRSPLYLRLCVADVLATLSVPGGTSQFHFHHHGQRGNADLEGRGDQRSQFIDAAVRNSTGNGNINNLIQMRMDHLEHSMVFAQPGVSRAILFLIACSSVGMLEEEMAELAMVPGGASGTEWLMVFSAVSSLLTCHRGRWNFAHDAIRRGVLERFTTDYVEWAFMSSMYSYFSSKLQASNAKGDPRPLERQRAKEELEDRGRFPHRIFSPKLSATGLKFDEVKLIGWAMQYNCTLTSLSLASNRMGNRGTKLIATGIQDNTKLLKLDVSDNGIGIEGATALAACLRRNSTLQQLNLSKNRIQVRGAVDIGLALKNNHSLLVLNVSRNSLYNAGTEALAVALKYNVTLQDLSLASNSISTPGITALAAALKGNVALTTLSLRHNPMHAEGHEAFSECLRDKSRGLAKVDLADTKIDAVAMKHLGDGLRDNSSVLSLDISANEMGDAGSSVLGQMLSNVEVLHVNSSLKDINMSNNAISTAGAVQFLDAIQHNGALLALDLSENKIDETMLNDVESWLKINRKLSALGPQMRKLERPLFARRRDADAERRRVVAEAAEPAEVAAAPEASPLPAAVSV